MGSGPLRDSLVGQRVLVGTAERFPGSLAQAWEWVWPSHRNVCRNIQGPFQGRDLEGVSGGVCEAVTKQLHPVAVFSE